MIKHNIIKDSFIEEAIVYVDKNNNPTLEITDKIKSLGTCVVRCYYKDKDNRAFEQFAKNYPEYKGYIMLF